MSCLLCPEPAPQRATVADALQAMREAGWAEVPGIGVCCRSCVDEARRFAAGIATVAIEEPYDVAPITRAAPETDPCDDHVRGLFVRLDHSPRAES